MPTRRGLLLGTGTAIAATFASRITHAAPQPVVHRPFVLVIDPGHGGSNHGCHSRDRQVTEKELTLVLARRLAARMGELLPHAEVVLTREDDSTMALAERVALANAVGANLFLSIHTNASVSREQHGFETFVLDVNASNLEAARTAQRENDEGFAAPERRDDVQVMLRELGIRANHGRAVRFADAIQRRQAHRFPHRLDRGVRQAPFDVLMGARMPAVLTELAFLDHAEEGMMLRHPDLQGAMCDGLAEAVVEYYREVERKK